MDYTDLPYIVEPMRLRDITAVMEIEHDSFPSPWSAHAYRHELLDNDLSHYFVVRQRQMGETEFSLNRSDFAPPGSLRHAQGRAPDPGQKRRSGNPLRAILDPLTLLARARRSLGAETRPPILGYGGFWMMAGEAHISTIAVQSSWRRLGIGELLLVAMLDRATELEADMATLEVRVSNVTAQNLYRKYGFRQAGLRRRYYRDNDEDALIMSTERLTSANFQSHFQQLKRVLREKLTQGLDKMP
jgi:ribosomal-protein-alanine N-acetyltransferase